MTNVEEVLARIDGTVWHTHPEQLRALVEALRDERDDLAAHIERLNETIDRLQRGEDAA